MLLKQKIQGLLEKYSPGVRVFVEPYLDGFILTCVDPVFEDLHFYYSGDDEELLPVRLKFFDLDLPLSRDGNISPSFLEYRLRCQHLWGNLVRGGEMAEDELSKIYVVFCFSPSEYACIEESRWEDN